MKANLNFSEYFFEKGVYPKMASEVRFGENRKTFASSIVSRGTTRSIGRGDRRRTGWTSRARPVV